MGLSETEMGRTGTQEAPIETHHDAAVLIVDDQAPFRAVARAVIELAPGFSVADETATGEDAVAIATGGTIDVVLMDINLPGISGIEATRRITAASDRPVVVLLSTYDEDSLPADATTCGAVRYVHKEDFSPLVLLEVWAEAGAGDPSQS